MLERVYFNTEDEIELVGLLERPTNPTKRVVISVHGMQSNCLKRREDILSKENVLKAFNFKGRKKGARQIKMVLKDRFNIIYN